MEALNHCVGAELLQELPKSPNNLKYFLQNNNLLSKGLWFDHGGAKLRPWSRRVDHNGAKLVFCPGCHLTSLRP